jgi:excisionase family DNA binding protein
MLTTDETAEKLKVTRRRVLALISSGRLAATRFGQAWMIDPASLATLKHRKPGRPPKAIGVSQTKKAKS